MLGLSQDALAALAHISTPRVIAIESERNCLQSTFDAIVEQLEHKGAVFERNGSVRIAQKSEKFILGPGDPDAETIHAAKLILAAAAKSRKPVGGLG
jgi:hypothetical protein